MKRLLLLAGTLGIILAGCHDGRADGTPGGQKLPYDHWQFNFFYPVNLPALVTMVSVQDGAARESLFWRLDPTEPSQSSIGKWSLRIGGFPANFNTGRALPVRMTVCWDSVIDKRAYETEIWFGQETRQQMTTAYADTYRAGKTYYRDKMIIGLAPGGTVRVWLKDNRHPAVLQHPVRQRTLTGDDRLICKNVPGRIDFSSLEADGYDPFIRDFIKGKTYPYGSW